jgi:hypothetical protein
MTDVPPEPTPEPEPIEPEPVPEEAFANENPYIWQPAAYTDLTDADLTGHRHGIIPDESPGRFRY